MSQSLIQYPRFITLEGGEGAGKSSAIRTIANVLQQHGKNVVITREPGGTPVAEKLREILLNPDSAEKLVPDAELLLMFATRAQHIHHVILPALQRGDYVVSDRFTDSSYAYQVGGRGLSKQWVEQLERHVVGFQPALTLFLDVNVKEGRARAHQRDGSADRIEQEQDDFFLKVHDYFSELTDKNPQRFRRINANQPVEQVLNDVTDVITQFLHHSSDKNL